MATVATQPMTAAEFAALDLDVPAELIRGEVMEMCRPGMRHGITCRNLVVSLDQWARSNPIPYLAIPESGIITERNPDTVRGPDVYLIRRDRLPAEASASGFLEVPPDLCIEVFSPKDNWKDVIAKVDEYLQAGVPEVWVVEPDEGQTYIYRPDAPPRTILRGEAIESGTISGLKLLFHDVYRDVSTAP